VTDDDISEIVKLGGITRTLIFGTVVEERAQFHEAKEHQAKPEVDQSPEVELERSVTRRRGEVGIQGEIEGVS
jgi:hypothetical protein